MTKAEAAILSYLKSNPDATQRQIRRDTGYAPSTIIKNLRERGLILAKGGYLCYRFPL